MSEATSNQQAQIAWKVNDWRRSVPQSKSQVHEYISDGTLPSVKIGGARFIIESPAAFVERHRNPAA